MARKTKRGEMRIHYDFSGGVRGKHAARYAEGANVVVLAPEVTEAFPDSDGRKNPLRTLIDEASKAESAPPKRAG